MSVKKKKPPLPSLTAIKRILATCAFDPRADGPFNIIATTAGRNYHEARAIEMIRDAVDALDLNGEAEIYQEKMKMAIGLLALSLSEAPTVSER